MLESKTYRLRAVEPGDLDRLMVWENDSSTWWLGSVTAPFSRALLERYIESGQDIYADKQIRFMLDSKFGHEWATVGAVDIYDFDPRNLRAGVGIIVDENHRRSGHASNGLNLLKSYAFKHLSLHQLYAEVPVSNTASVRLFQNSGYVAGEKKSDWIKGDKSWEDVLCMQLLNNTDKQAN